MTRWLLNSAMMPAGCYGAYLYEPATKDDLRAFLDWHTSGPYESRIGYPETAKRIEGWTGILPQISREPSTMAPGDVAMVVRLRYRVDPSTKGAPVGGRDEDWEIARLTYRG